MTDPRIGPKRRKTLHRMLDDTIKRLNAADGPQTIADSIRGNCGSGPVEVAMFVTTSKKHHEFEDWMAVQSRN